MGLGVDQSSSRTVKGDLFMLAERKTAGTTRFRAAVASVVIATMTLPHASVFAQDRSKDLDLRNQKNTVLANVLDSVGKRYSAILSKLSPKMVNQVELEKRIELNAQIETRIKALKEGTITPKALREELIKVGRESLEEQKQEIFYQIHNLPTDKLDELAESMADNDSYEDARMAYESAFTRTEKANALAQAVYQDLDHLFSMMGKRSNFMNEQALVNDLKSVQNLYNTKGDADEDRWLKVLGYAALTVAAVGVVSWGIASGVYSGRYNDRRSQLQNQFNKLKTDLENRYNTLTLRLDQEEKQYLADNGFVYQQCAKYEAPDSIVCNRYDYQKFSGTKFCSVNCYKNTATGQETLHGPVTCTSPFIPADCYDPADYDSGYAQGKADGRTDGKTDGGNDGWEAGAEDGWEIGYEDGDVDGYTDGYTDGFEDGYNAYFGTLSTPLQVNSTTATSTGTISRFDSGYQDGLRDAELILSLNAS